MGSKLSRHRSLDLDGALSKRRRRRHDKEAAAEPERTGREFLFTSLMLKSDKLPGMLRRSSRSPYVRRVAWIREMQQLLREHKTEQAAEVLKLLRKDLGLLGTSLNDILYKNAAFLNLVDPISHELLLALARDLQCPKREVDALKSTNKICRQLLYHLTPHSKWTRQSVPRSKSQACLKTTLQTKQQNDVLNLSGIPLSGRDIHRLVFYLPSSGDSITAVDLSFTELQDDSLRLLLPVLGALTKLTVLAINGNRLTAAVLKDLTDAVKDPKRFPRLAWVDLGNNVDIFTVPQPLLVALRRRYGLRGSLPTIYECSEMRALSGYDPNLETSVEEASICEEGERDGAEDEDGDELEDRLELRGWSCAGGGRARNVMLHHCGR